MLAEGVPECSGAQVQQIHSTTIVAVALDRPSEGMHSPPGYRHVADDDAADAVDGVAIADIDRAVVEAVAEALKEYGVGLAGQPEAGLLEVVAAASIGVVIARA